MCIEKERVVRAELSQGLPAPGMLVSIRLVSRMLVAGLLCSVTGLLGGCGDAAKTTAAQQPAAAASTLPLSVDVQASQQAVATAVADLGREGPDRRRDALDKPIAVLGFMGVAPGMKVLQLFAGDGYLTEILARAVGPQGVVYVTRLQNDARLASLGNVRVVTEVGTQVPADSLDRVIIADAYHMAVNMGLDRRVLLGEAITALKAGGVLGIVDYSALPDSRDRDVGTLGRIDQAFVLHEVTTLGFIAMGQSNALRTMADDRTLLSNDESLSGHPDRFVFKFNRPAGITAPVVEATAQLNEIIEPGMPGGVDGITNAPVQDRVEDVRGRIDAYGDAVTKGQRPVEMQ